MIYSVFWFLCCFVIVKYAEGFTVIHLNLDEDNEIPIGRTQAKAYTENLNKELLNGIIKIVQKQGNDLTNVAIHKCLRERRSKLNKLVCVKNLVERSKHPGRSWYHSDFNLLNEYLNEKLQNQETTTHKNFVDLTRSSEDKVSNFAENDVSDTTSTEGRYKTFDRSEFAEDYVDFSGLRSGHRQTHHPDKEKLAFYKVGATIHRHDMKSRRNEDFIRKKILRTNDDSESESEVDSSDEHTRKRKHKYYHQYSLDLDSVESEEIRKPKKFIRKEPLSYMQAPTRIYEIDMDRRRRLPHFLPKRYHWDEEDFKDLKHYWIHGPQGKYAGAYRIPY